MPEELPQIAPVHPVARGGDRPPADDEIDLTELLGVLIEGKGLILATAIVVTLLGAAYAFLATPIYKADALIQVEQKNGGMKGLEMLSDMFGAEATSEAEIELIRSRAVLNQVIDRMHLDIEIEPKFFPILGQAAWRRHAGEGVAPPSFDADTYAWGGERLTFEKLVVPSWLENQRLTLKVLTGDQFALFDDEGTELVRGELGQELDDATQNGISLLVTELVAREGTEFHVTKINRSEAISRLHEVLGVRERGKKTGIIEIDLQGDDRQKISQALDALTGAYVRQNVARKAAEAENTLNFVLAQLPLQKAALDEAEIKLNEYRKKTGKMELGMEAQSIVGRAAEIEKGITELQLQESEMRQRFTDSHPVMEALKKKLASLDREKRAVDQQAKGLPEAQLNSVRLVRDVTVANELYVFLLNKGQELKLVKSGTIGNVRVVDAALVKPHPVKPKKSLALALSLVLGLGAGVALTFLRRALNGGVEDPEVLEQSLGIPVYASVPFSQKQAEMSEKALKGKGKLEPLAVLDSADLSIESLRSLRTSLQFSLAAAKNNLLVISGSRPAIGKSFVSVNLAHVLADAGKRVLLVDADLRKGQLHRYFGQARDGGFAELIAGEKPFEALVRPTANPNLSFLASGRIPPNPSELLSSTRCEETLKALAASYDLVLIDAPPVLAVTDAALIARHAGVNLLVVKAGLHPLRELALAINRFQQSGVRPNGFVFNAVPMGGRFYGYGRYRYHYQYEYR